MTIRYVRHPDLLLTAFEDEGIVMHLTTRRYFTVTPGGVAVLELIDEPRTLEEIVTVLTSRYEVSAEVAAQTTREFLEAGCRDGLVVETP